MILFENHYLHEKVISIKIIIIIIIINYYYYYYYYYYYSFIQSEVTLRAGHWNNTNNNNALFALNTKRHIYIASDKTIIT